MQIETLKAERRSPKGTREARRIRQTGMVPGVVYGHKQDPEAVLVARHDIEQILAHGTHAVTLDLGGKQEPCLLKDVQYDHFGVEPMHVDFARVDLNERVTVKVPIVLRGDAKGLSEGGHLEQHKIDIEIECQVVNIPHELRVSVADLGLNQALHVSDVKLPEGMVAQDDADAVIVVCREASKHVDETSAEGAAAEGAEPEVIAKGKEEDSDEG
jgi:large subunit ribosomal protein L25